MSGELRVALVGFGLAGSTFHAPLIAATPGLALTTVVTTDAERAARARSEHPGVVIEPHADAVWERAAEHELAVIATANAAHVELASRAIDAGLAVVVDKPLAPTSAEARAVVERAESRGVVLTVFHNRRWDSDQLTLERLLKEGALGQVHRYESRFERWRPQLRPGAWRETTPPERGGGLLFDLGTHLVDQALVHFGPVADVHGEVDAPPGRSRRRRRLRRPHPRLRGAQPSMGLIGGGGPGPRLRVLGSEAAYVVDGLSTARSRRWRAANGPVPLASGEPSRANPGAGWCAARAPSRCVPSRAPGRATTPSSNRPCARAPRPRSIPRRGRRARAARARPQGLRPPLDCPAGG